MSDLDENKTSDFMIEKFKERPINKKKLLKRTLTTAGLAVLFGLVACVTFLVLEPVISNKLYPEEEPQEVVFPQDQDEMSPEDMLSDNMQIESQINQIVETGEDVTLDRDQVQSILSNVVLSKDNYRQIYNSLSGYVEEMNKSMVTVTGVTSNIDWFNNVEQSRNQSSGIIVANNGRQLLALVNYSSLGRTEQLTLEFCNGVQADAQLKSLDPDTNLAIVTVELDNLDRDMVEKQIQVASLGSSTVKNMIGTPVIALGSPMGSRGSIGYGMITATGTQDTIADMNYTFLQTDIYGSQSGEGVLFNLQGQVVGIITGNKSGTEMRNLITAYGITELKKQIEKMSNGEKLAYLGICGVDVTEEANEKWNVPYGAFVKEVKMDSPSMLAGIQQGDIIVKIDEKDITKYNDYISYLMQLSPGQTVNITVMRQAQNSYREVEFEMELGRKE